MKRITNSCLVIMDQADRRVLVETPKKRIVSLAPSNTEIIYALGAEDRLCGVTNYCDYPEGVKSKSKVGGYSTVDMDLIRQAEPDLILAGVIHLKGPLSELEKLGCPIIVLEASIIEEMFRAIKIIGFCTGKDREAFDFVASLKNRLNKITSKTRSIKLEDRPRVFYLHECQTWKTFGAKTIGDTLTDLAGGYNIGRDFGDYYPYPTLVDIATKNPDVIIAETGFTSNPLEPLDVALAETVICGVNARKSGRIYGVNSDLISRPGPRMVDGIEKLAKIFHPEIFETSSSLNGIADE